MKLQNNHWQEFNLNSTTYPNYWSKLQANAKSNVFYIHGFADTPEAFSTCLNSINDHNIYAVVLPGHDQSSFKSISDLKISRYVELCIDLITSLNLHEVTLIGHSMGGGIATLIASALHDRIHKLILITPMNSHCVNFQSIINYFLNFNPKSISSVERFYKPLVNPINLQSFVSDFGDDVITNFKTHQQAYKLLKKQIASRANLKLLGIAEQNIRCSTLLITGHYDHGINNAQTIKHIKRTLTNVIHISFEASGHFPFIEEPELFNKTMLDFMNK